MVLLTITSPILEALKFLQDGKTPLDLQPFATDPSLDNPALYDPISHGQVIALSQKLEDAKSTSSGTVQIPPHSLQLLLYGSRVYAEPPKAKLEPVSETMSTPA